MEEHTWDRSHDWEIHRWTHHRCEIFILLNESDLVRQLMAIRQISQKYRDVPPSQVRNSIDHGKLPLGRFGSIDSIRIREQAASQGLKLELVDVSTERYLPFDKTTNMAWVIEDDIEAARIAREMIAAGIPVVPIEAD